MSEKKDCVFLRIRHSDGGVLLVGSWAPAGELNDNFSAQSDIGWHCFFQLSRDPGAIIEVVRGDMDDPELYPTQGDSNVR